MTSFVDHNFVDCDTSFKSSIKVLILYSDYFFLRIILADVADAFPAMKFLVELSEKRLLGRPGSERMPDYRIPTNRPTGLFVAF